MFAHRAGRRSVLGAEFSSGRRRPHTRKDVWACSFHDVATDSSPWGHPCTLVNSSVPTLANESSPVPCPCFAGEPREAQGGHRTQAPRLDVLLTPSSLSPSPGGRARLGGRLPVSLRACSLGTLDIPGHNPAVPLDPGATGSPSDWC